MIQSTNKCPIKVAERVIYFLQSDVPWVTLVHKNNLAALLWRNNTYRLRLVAVLAAQSEEHRALLEQLSTVIDSSLPLIQFFYKKGFVQKSPRKK
jgi:hypothetical protein